MDKPKFVPPRCPAEYIARKIKTHDELRLEALETAMAEVFSWTWTAAQSQPAEPVDVRDRVSISREMLNFLTGIGSLEGLWFGDRSPHRKGAWWWRSLLRNDALSTPAREVPVGDEVELIVRALCPNGADEIVQGGDVVGETIDMPAWMLYLPEARRVISALRTPACEVPDESVPSWRFNNGMLAGKIDGDELASHLRTHGMKIVYCEGPRDD